MINWRVRVTNRQFWLSFIPAVLLLIQAIAALFGFTLDFDALGAKLITVIDAIFMCLAILGVVVDPTTEGVKDSVRAMQYEEPWKDDDCE